jgi:phage tail sheath gpL-like
MAVQFNKIPQGLRIPGFFYEVDPSRAAQTDDPGRMVVFGQKLAAGSAVAGQVYPIPSLDRAKELFGVGSQIVGCLAGVKRADPFGLLYAVGLADGGGATKASMTITVTAAATVAGQVPLYVAGVSVPVVVSGTETVNQTATAIGAAINAMADLPVVATVLNAVVTVEARNAGTLGNDIDVRLGWLGAAGGEAIPTTFAATLSAAALAGGATDPVVTGAFAALGDTAYDYVVMPYTDAANLNAADAAMGENGGRWSYNRMVWGHVFTARRGSVATCQTLGLGRNGPHVSILAVWQTPTPVWDWLGAAIGAAAVVLRNDPARPVQEIEIPGVLAPPPGSTGRFTMSERNTLLYSGISTHEVGADNVVRLERLISTYQLNALGQIDEAWLSVEKIFTLMRVMRRLQAAWRAAFPRAKLAPNGSRAGIDSGVVTPSTGKAMVVAEMRRMEAAGLLSDVDAMVPFLRLEINGQNPDRMDMVFPPKLIGQLRMTAVLAQFRVAPIS